MTDDTHFRSLERMNLAAPINDFDSHSVEVSEGTATLEIELSQ